MHFSLSFSGFTSRPFCWRSFLAFLTLYSFVSNTSTTHPILHVWGANVSSFSCSLLFEMAGFAPTRSTSQSKPVFCIYYVFFKSSEAGNTSFVGLFKKADALFVIILYFFIINLRVRLFLACFFLTGDMLANSNNDSKMSIFVFVVHASISSRRWHVSVFLCFRQSG